MSQMKCRCCQQELIPYVGRTHVVCPCCFDLQEADRPAQRVYGDSESPARLRKEAMHFVGLAGLVVITGLLALLYLRLLGR